MDEANTVRVFLGYAGVDHMALIIGILGQAPDV